MQLLKILNLFYNTFSLLFELFFLSIITNNYINIKKITFSKFLFLIYYSI